MKKSMFLNQTDITRLKSMLTRVPASTVVRHVSTEVISERIQPKWSTDPDNVA